MSFKDGHTLSSSANSFKLFTESSIIPFNQFCSDGINAGLLPSNPPCFSSEASARSEGHVPSLRLRLTCVSLALSLSDGLAAYRHFHPPQSLQCIFQIILDFFYRREYSPPVTSGVFLTFIRLWARHSHPLTGALSTVEPLVPDR